MWIYTDPEKLKNYRCRDSLKKLRQSVAWHCEGYSPRRLSDQLLKNSPLMRGLLLFHDNLWFTGVSSNPLLSLAAHGVDLAEHKTYLCWVIPTQYAAELKAEALALDFFRHAWEDASDYIAPEQPYTYLYHYLVEKGRTPLIDTTGFTPLKYIPGRPVQIFWWDQGGNRSSMRIETQDRDRYPEVLDRLQKYQVTGTVERVTRSAPQVYPAIGVQRVRVALMDYGVKQNMIECLRKRGCEVTVFPAHTPAAEILGGGFDGVMLSNGPGDPAENVEIIAELKKLYNSDIPLFGVCLGHQLLALATGARTGRLAYGHRGGNHPVRDLEKGRVFITSQNHGYMVLSDSVDPSVAEVSHVNVNDGTCEGLNYKRPNCFTTQFHPEANAGPKDTEYLFNRFIDSMGGAK